MKKTLCILPLLLLLGCGTRETRQANQPQLIDLPEQKLLTLRLQGPFEKMNAAFGQIYAEAGRLGAQPAGVPYAVYYNDPAKTKPADYDWEVCAPVRTAVQPKAPVVFRSEPAGKAVSLVYTGPYGTAEHTGSYTRLLAFGKTLSGYRFSGPPREIYHEIQGYQGGKKNVTQICFPMAPAR